ncbi:hypothetical protein BC834DRAFT_507559 [Gloeopeniophorella convolvens]|nr:hypothetical protein BC834DRAFT_507559 [Gloeopeniophorella convolvens]
MDLAVTTNKYWGIELSIDRRIIRGLVSCIIRTKSPDSQVATWSPRITLAASGKRLHDALGGGGASALEIRGRLGARRPCRHRRLSGARMTSCALHRFLGCRELASTLASRRSCFYCKYVHLASGVPLVTYFTSPNYAQPDSACFRSTVFTTKPIGYRRRSPPSACLLQCLQANG